MKIYTDISQFKARNPVVTIGMFDGVHCGHRAILEHVKDAATQCDGESVVLTFWPHPRMLFEGKDCSMRFLTSIEEKAALLESIGIEHFIVYPFSPEFASLSPLQYVEEILVKRIALKKVIIGYDHRFGHKGSGGFDEMVTFGMQFGFEVEQIPAVDVDDVNVSSSKIREALLHGNVDKAKAYLSYTYRIPGTVIKGNQIGRTIGFPTINIEPLFAQKLIPGNGIYVVEVVIDDCFYHAVANVGNRPTVVENQKVPNVEAYILDFNDDVYGKKVEIRFLAFLREEQKFASLDALIEQIQKDVVQTREYFGTVI